ncbi:Nif3-like dinuclear metal center hexameric protein [Campylobacter sp. FMV-PI01]|uniref:GTP cyclohydrolase 1 type 2 homolog n=1 Tax=Campylobacter portucalensis TaxID=2608384 RepID=A0A6L5WI14_9BACT|nr:Nif3-like dinuclear metal center hexameric protein [Campylobacter portucalensis]MSN96092.1 Nif3-like dinuclear metal center hexameric protein [Campylobacter portucalensis]
MKISEIYKILDEIAPFEFQESWDNSGILLGSMQSEFDKIYLSLDIDSDMLDKVDENSLVITHHPLIFKGLKNIDFTKYPSNLIYKMIKKDIKLISMHTNFDKCILNRYVATEILKYKIVDEQDFLIFMEVNMEFDKLCFDIKTKLNIKNLRVVKSKNYIKNIALCTGSGSDLIGKIEVDCFLTGDLKYHTALENLENKLSLIDINHYESECYFAESLAKNLQKNKIKAIITNSVNPFSYI